MNETVKTKSKKVKKEVAESRHSSDEPVAAKSSNNNEIELKNQLNYAQKLINILQNKLNEVNATSVQLEAQLILVNEDKENILKQVKEFGITPQ